MGRPDFRRAEVRAANAARRTSRTAVPERKSRARIRHGQLRRATGAFPFRKHRYSRNISACVKLVVKKSEVGREEIQFVTDELGRGFNDHRAKSGGSRMGSPA